MGPLGSIFRGVRRRLDGRPPDLAYLTPLSDGRRAAIPDADFVCEEFDRTDAPPTIRMIVILSTPRSGSTFLCQLLHHAVLCTPHEYFQPHDYLPLLAFRWNCVDNGRVAWDRYACALERHRTSDLGVLGINLHGSHLRRFARALPHFSAPEAQYVWLQRRDKLRQAVSYGIATQTGQWSSEFKRGVPPAYRFEHFHGRLRVIQHQEALIQAFVAAHSINPDLLYYEDLSTDPKSVLPRVFGVDFRRSSTGGDRSLRPQRNSINDDFLQQFAADLLAGRGA
jgi:LPS sulfotransferase NodH